LGLPKVCFRVAFELSGGSGHTCPVPAGASGCFVDGWRLRSVSDVLPVNRSPADLLRGEFLDQGHPSLLSQSKRYRPRSPRPPPAGRRAETETAAVKTELLGPTLLDHTPPMLVPLAARPGPGETRHRGWLAPRRLPSLLALAIPATRRPTEDYRGDSRSDPTLSARTRIGEPRRSTESC
jgi:hypothetical protein